MTTEKIEQLIASMSLEEKSRILWQPMNRVYDANGVLTYNNVDITETPEEIYGSGSTLNLFGVDKIKNVQKEHIKNNPHGIPMIFMGDIIHGFATIFPLPLAQSCSFNPELVKEACKVVADESTASGVDVTYFPMVDLVRDPRWGRVMESAGEDPYLASLYCAAMVKGFQGDDLTTSGMAACVKHFAGYGGAEGGRDYNSVELSERTLRQYYLPAYKAGVDAGAKMMMTSYNTIGGIPSTCNKHLFRDILRDEWGFKGTVITDLYATASMSQHGISNVPETLAEAIIKTGIDIEMGSFNYRTLPQLVREGKVDEELVDNAVRNVLNLVNDLGLFENPHRFADESRAKELYYCDKHLAVAKRLSIESCVLLENQDGILPLNERSGKVAFIGPFVDFDKLDGNWSLVNTLKEERDKKITEQTLRQELEKRFGKEKFVFAGGCSHLGREQQREAERFGYCDEENRERGIQEAVELAKAVDTVVLTLGELPSMSGEARCRSNIRVPDVQLELLNRIYEVNSNIVVLLYNGRPLDLREVKEKAKAILDVWYLGSQMNQAIVDLLFGIAAPSGRLSMSFPHSVGQIPVYYNHLPTDHNMPPYDSSYIDDCPRTALYPFGYGLTYTSFRYSKPTLSKNTFNKNERITVCVEVTNTGAVDGYEVVQLYIRDRFATVSRPVKELKGFKKVLIKAGETVTVSFDIGEDMLRYYNINMDYVSDPGEFHVFVGKDSSVTEYAVFYLEDEYSKNG